MSFLTDKRKRKKFIWLISIALALAILIGACAIYLCDYYRADSEAIAAFMPQGTDWIEHPDGNISLEPEGATRGLIFYPGGKVEYTAYLPLMQACAESGILCVLVEMPFNLAVLDINAANGIQEEYPEIEEWYIGGHSLGGSMAASYVADHTDEFAGLILLGSYSTADLSGTDIKVLSVYGSEDKIMNREKYAENKDNLPRSTTETILEGGNHAGFGMYGEQEGDGKASITNEEQIRATASIIATMINE